jgi:hypothetical protein
MSIRAIGSDARKLLTLEEIATCAAINHFGDATHHAWAQRNSLPYFATEYACACLRRFIASGCPWPDGRAGDPSDAARAALAKLESTITTKETPVPTPRRGFIASHFRHYSIDERLDRLVRAGGALSTIYDHRPSDHFDESERTAWKAFEDALALNEHRPGTCDRNGHAFNVGARVVSIGPVDRFPHFLLPPGVTGTVSLIERSMVYIRVDDPWAAQISEEWDHEVSCCFDGGDAPAPWEEWIVTTPARRKLGAEDYAGIAAEGLALAMDHCCRKTGDLDTSWPESKGLAAILNDIDSLCDWNPIAPRPDDRARADR